MQVSFSIIVNASQKQSANDKGRRGEVKGAFFILLQVQRPLMAELGNRLSFCKGNIKTKQITLTSISITLHEGMLTKNLHHFSSFDLDRQIVQARIRATVLVSTT